MAAKKWRWERFIYIFVHRSMAGLVELTFSAPSYEPIENISFKFELIFIKANNIKNLKLLANFWISIACFNVDLMEMLKSSIKFWCMFVNFIDLHYQMASSQMHKICKGCVLLLPVYNVAKFWEVEAPLYPLCSENFVISPLRWFLIQMSDLNISRAYLK